MKLSQCMIVKNEEENIRRALSWGKGIVCEQIVVDTGSTDQTVAIAKEMGAKVFFFEWADDFSAAKNFALNKAMGDWIAFLDADEYFTDADAAKIPAFLERIENLKMDKGKEKGSVINCSIVHLGKNGEILGIQIQSRLFRNKNYIKYQGRIHEQIHGLNHHRLTVVDLTEELSIYHTGYAWTEDLRARKGERNVSLLKQEVAKKPKSAMLLLYLAESLSMMGEHGEAFRYACKASRNTDGSLNRERLLTAYQMQLYEAVLLLDSEAADEDTVQEIYRQAAAFDGDYPDFDIAMGKWQEKNGNREASVAHYEMALDKANRYGNSTSSRIMEFIKEMYRKLIEFYSEKGDWGRIVKYGTLYLQLEPYEPGILLPILNRLLKAEGEPVQRVMGYLGRLYQMDNRKELYFLLKQSRLAGFPELEWELKKYLSEEEREKIYGSR